VVLADQTEEALLPRASDHGVEEGQIRIRSVFEQQCSQHDGTPDVARNHTGTLQVPLIKQFCKIASLRSEGEVLAVASL
jgi:hypothetical protein